MGKEVLYYVLFAAAGGFVTSLIEYLLKYNLIDLIVGIFSNYEKRVTTAGEKLLVAAEAAAAKLQAKL